MQKARLRRKWGIDMAGEGEKRRVDREDLEKVPRFFYEDFFEQSPEAIVMEGLDGRVLEANASFCDMFGYDREEVKGRVLENLVAADSQTFEQAARILNNAARGQRFTLETIRHRKDGTPLQVLLFGIPIIVNGDVTAVYAIYHDISPRKQAEESLRKSEALLRLAGHLAHLGGWSADLVENRVYWSEEVAAIHDMPPGYSPTVEEGITFYAPEYRNKIAEVFEKCAKEGISYDEEMQILSGKGKRIWVRTVGVPERDEAGRIVRVLGCFQDITARKQSEQELREALEKMIGVLAELVERRDPYTAGHQKKVAELSRAIALEMDLGEERAERVAMAGAIHDIGKISIPAEVLSRPGKLSPIEMELVRQHPQQGCEILKDVQTGWPLAEVVYQHHERLDGSGYPQGLKDGEILLEARILGVADVVEAMASYRPYRPSLGIDAALEEIESKKGLLYDPEVVSACLRLFREKDFVFDR
ncbi:MAG: HD domain-containing phosphohydrolase [Thermovirgaceae bacterium]